MNMIMRRRLTITQQQAYSGAKCCYLCVLPAVMVALVIAHLYYIIIGYNKITQQQSSVSSSVSKTQMTPNQIYNNYNTTIIEKTSTLSVIFWIMLSIVSYYLAVKYYKLCNTINVQVQPQHIININTNTNININTNINSNIQLISSQNATVSKSHNHQQQQQHEFDSQQQQQQQEQEEEQQQQQYHNQYQQQNHYIKPPYFPCKYCNIPALPYRCRHCNKCQTCIFRYDHHCFWIGNCVGYANHRQFWGFLLLQTVNNWSNVIITIQLNDITHYINQVIGNVRNIWVSVCIYGVILTAFGFLIFTAYLLIYHTMLMITGMTTWQHMSRSRITFLKYLPVGFNPFSQGIYKNVVNFWVHSGQIPIYDVPTYQQAKTMEPVCNLIQNKYYSCC